MSPADDDASDEKTETTRKHRKNSKEKKKRMLLSHQFELLRRLLRVGPTEDKQLIVQAAIDTVTALCTAKTNAVNVKDNEVEAVPLNKKARVDTTQKSIPVGKKTFVVLFTDKTKTPASLEFSKQGPFAQFSALPSSALLEAYLASEVGCVSGASLPWPGTGTVVAGEALRSTARVHVSERPETSLAL